MDIGKYLTNIEIPVENESQINEFIGKKRIEIEASIRKMWEEYSASELNSSVVDEPVEEVTLIDNTDKVDSVPEQVEEILEINKTVPFEINRPESDELTAEAVPPSMPPSVQQVPSKDTLTPNIQTKSKNMILPNGKVSQEYKHLVNIASLAIPDISDYWFEGLEAFGLAYTPDTNEITGVPTLAGDHKITLKIKLKDWTEGKPIISKEITVIINPDPKSLWKNIPTPADIEYFKPDSAHEFLKVEGHKGFFGIGKTERKDIVAASQRGRSHAQEGKPRDDDFGMKYIEDLNWYIVTVADGAGSAAASRKGSEIACKTVVDVCETLIKEKHKDFENFIRLYHADKSEENRKKVGDSLYAIIGNAVFKAVKNIEEEAKTSSKALKDFSTTLIVSICKKFKFGWFVADFWVGDGGIGIYNKETQFLKVMGESDGGEFAGQTRFLTMPEITQPTELYRRLRFEIVDDFTAIILMTDGVTDPKFETDANLLRIEKWNALWEDLSKEVQFLDNNETTATQLLNWLNFWSPGNHDDRTIAILF
jgi:serine/threonine protein phosphatase PrpC